MMRTMAGLGRCRVERLARGNLVGISSVCSRHLTDDSRIKASPKVYELRTYHVKPKCFADFVKLTRDNIHLRTAHSKICGYWLSELGGLNQAIHICEYDSFAHRSAVRKALSEDETWMNNYIANFLKMLVKQENAVMRSVPWYLVKPETPVHEGGGVYEMCVDTLLPGKMEQWTHRHLMEGLKARCKFSEPVGIWTGEVGPLSTVYHLWRYKSMDDRTEVKTAALHNEEWRETVRDCAAFTAKMENKILVPAPWSDWK